MAVWSFRLSLLFRIRRRYDGRIFASYGFSFSDEAAVYQVILLEKPEMKERSVLCHVQLEGKVNDEDLQKSEYGRTFYSIFREIPLLLH